MAEGASQGWLKIGKSRGDLGYLGGPNRNTKILMSCEGRSESEWQRHDSENRHWRDTEKQRQEANAPVGPPECLALLPSVDMWPLECLRYFRLPNLLYQSPKTNPAHYLFTRLPLLHSVANVSYPEKLVPKWWIQAGLPHHLAWCCSITM